MVDGNTKGNISGTCQRVRVSSLLEMTISALMYKIGGNKLSSYWSGAGLDDSERVNAAYV